MTKELADVLRTAIDRSRRSYLELSQSTGVPVSRISEFMSGGDMRLKNAGKLARCLGLELKSKSKRKRGKT